MPYISQKKLNEWKFRTEVRAISKTLLSIIIILFIVNMYALIDLNHAIKCENFNKHRDVNSDVGNCRSWTPSQCIVKECGGYEGFRFSMGVIFMFTLIIVINEIILYIRKDRSVK